MRLNKRKSMLVLIMACLSLWLAASPAFADREAHGDGSFEEVLRSQPVYGSKVLPAIEAALAAEGLVRPSGEEMKMEWKTPEGARYQEFVGTIWYRSQSSWAVARIVVRGRMGVLPESPSQDTLQIDSITVDNQGA